MKDSAEDPAGPETTGYRIISRLHEDERTTTHLAEDLRLGRKVVQVQLKPGVGEPGGREFLLRARVLGQLNHPGVLPVYDMGMQDEAYFYCHRPSPGPTLREALEQAEGRRNRLRSLNRRLQILLSLTDTLAYAHANGVAVGALHLDGIVMGDHGEVIIQDWSKMKWQGGFPREMKPGWVREDLRQLALLGLALVCNEEEVDANIDQLRWNRLVRDLPIDLQIILDRAYLERPQPYASALDFKKDLARYLEGRPTELNRGDILLSLQGLYRRNKFNVLLLALMLAVCFAVLSATLVRYDSLQRERKKLQGEVSRAEAKQDELKKDLATLTDEHKNQTEQRDLMVKTLSQINVAIGEAQQKAADASTGLDMVTGEVRGNKEELARLEKEVEQHQEQLALVETAYAKKLETDLAAVRKALAGPPENNGYLLAEYLALGETADLHLREQFKDGILKLFKPTGWFEQFLQGPDKAGLHLWSERMLAQGYRFHDVDASGFSLACPEGANNFLVFHKDRLDKPYAFGPLPKRIAQLVFSEDPMVLHAVVGTRQAMVIRLSPDYSTIASTVELPMPKAFRKLLPFSPPDMLRFSDGKGIVYEVDSSQDRKLSETDPEKLKFTEKILGRKDVLALAMGPKGLSACQTKEGIVFLRLSDPGTRLHLIEAPVQAMPVRHTSFGFLGPGWFYLVEDCALRLYQLQRPGKRDKESGEQSLRVVEKASLKLDGDILKVTLEPAGNKLWLQVSPLRSLCWTWEDGKLIDYSKIVLGYPKMAVGDKIIMASSDRIRVFSETPLSMDEYARRKGLFDPPPVAEPGKPHEKAVPAADRTTDVSALPLEKGLTHAYCPPGSDQALLIHGGHSLEIWDLKDQRLLAVLGTSTTALEKVTFAPGLRMPLTRDAKGQVRSW